MRLSSELNLMLAWWHEVRTGSAEFTAEGAEMFERLLRRSTELAKDLEERVPTADEAREVLAKVEAAMRDCGDVPVAADNVVPFRPAHRRGELVYIPIGDGGAA